MTYNIISKKVLKINKIIESELFFALYKFTFLNSRTTRINK